jgi:hypothetical protein
VLTRGLGVLTITRDSGASRAVNGRSANDSTPASGTATYAQNGLIKSFSINDNSPTSSDVLALSGNANGASGLLCRLDRTRTFTLDNAGNGTTSFANGSQKQVQGYFITSWPGLSDGCAGTICGGAKKQRWIVPVL